MLCPFGLKGVDRHRYWVSTVLLLVGRVNSAVDTAFTFSFVAGSPLRSTNIDRRFDQAISRGRLKLVNHQSGKYSRFWTPATVSPRVTMAARSKGSSSTSLSEFLQQASRDVKCTASRIHAFVGNEASDADSICSAICMAYFEGLSREGRSIAGDQPAGLTNESVDAKDVVHVPVVPIPRADLALRREVLVLFRLCGVDPADLVFIDEVDLRGLQVKRLQSVSSIPTKRSSSRPSSSLSETNLSGWSPRIDDPTRSLRGFAEPPSIGKYRGSLPLCVRSIDGDVDGTNVEGAIHATVSTASVCPAFRLLRAQGQGRLLVTLMDHNAVSGPLSDLGESVVRIVDHHKDLGEHPGVRGQARDIAFDGGSGGGKPLVGSCCTLVAERWLKLAPAMLPAEVAKLLLGVILIDTMNFDATAGRATPRDRAVADELVIRAAMNGEGDEAAGSRGGGQGDRGDSQVQALWEKLRSAKFDPEFWRELTVRDCLRYDYKRFTVGSPGGSDTPSVGGRSLAFGTSSMLCRLETLLRKPGAIEAIGNFARDREVEFVIVSTVTFDSEESGEMRKELLVFSEDRRRCEELETFLEGKGGEFLDLERMSWSGDRGGVSDGATAPGIDGTFALWEYRNLKVSRKQIVPAIISLYESEQGRA